MTRKEKEQFLKEAYQIYLKLADLQLKIRNIDKTYTYVIDDKNPKHKHLLEVLQDLRYFDLEDPITDCKEEAFTADKVSELTNKELKELRKQVCICSCYTKDYSNEFVREEDAYNFFNGYEDYLCGLIKENGKTDDDFEQFDNDENLIAWRDIVACGEER